MVNEIESHISTIKKTYNDFLMFLVESLNEVSKKSELLEYLNYIQSTKEHFSLYINSMNFDNSVRLYGLINGICRYYSEFDWFDDYDFYIRAQDFKSKLSKESQLIYNYYHLPDSQL